MAALPVNATLTWRAASPLPTAKPYPLMMGNNLSETTSLCALLFRVFCVFRGFSTISDEKADAPAEIAELSFQLRKR